MEKQEMKKCPYCAEMIKKEAIKCRHCGSELGKNGFRWIQPDRQWRRVKNGKKIAGVCTGIANLFELPILIIPLRLFFLITTLFYGFGFIIYILLWILMSAPDKTEEAKMHNAS